MNLGNSLDILLYDLMKLQDFKFGILYVVKRCQPSGKGIEQ